MTWAEFTEETAKLAETFPNLFPKPRIELIWKNVKDLDRKWYAALVGKMILSFNSKFDIAEAARTERNRLAGLRLSDDTTKAAETLNRESSDKGFQKALERFGANNLMEAIEKSKIKPERWDQK